MEINNLILSMSSQISGNKHIQLTLTHHIKCHKCTVWVLWKIDEKSKFFEECCKIINIWTSPKWKAKEKKDSNSQHFKRITSSYMTLTVYQTFKILCICRVASFSQHTTSDEIKVIKIKWLPHSPHQISRRARIQAPVVFDYHAHTTSGFYCHVWSCQQFSQVTNESKCPLKRNVMKKGTSQLEHREGHIF